MVPIDLQHASLFPEAYLAGDGLRPSSVDAEFFSRALLNALTEVDEGVIFSSGQDLALEVINQYTTEGLSRLDELVLAGATIDVLPYQAALTELNEFMVGFAKIPIDSHELVELITERIMSRVPTLSKERVLDLVNHGSLLSDVAFLSRRTKELTSSQDLIVQMSRWIYDSGTNRLIKMIGPEHYDLLSRSRSVGLIPFATLDALRSLRIGSIGASAVARSIDMLAALGVGHIEWWDGGQLQVSNGPRLPSGMSSFDRVGYPKATALQQEVQTRRPYDTYQGHVGRVVFDEAEVGRTGDDILFSDLSAKFDILLEVADSDKTKLETRIALENNDPDKIVIYLADVSDAFVGFEEPGRGNHFHQHLDQADLTHMLERPIDVSQHFEHILTNIVRILGKDFSVDHQLPFVLFLFHLLPFWPQTPISAGDSSALIGKMLVLHISKRSVIGRNVHASETPASLTPAYSPEQLQTLAVVMHQLFGLESNGQLALP